MFLKRLKEAAAVAQKLALNTKFKNQDQIYPSRCFWKLLSKIDKRRSRIAIFSLKAAQKW